jgi:hypothetical protein
MLSHLPCLPNPNPQAENDNNQMLMSQPTNATKLLRMTVMMGLMMLPLLWRRQMKQGKEGRRGRRGRKLGPRGRTSIYFIFLNFVSSHSLTTSSRKTWADRQQEDQIENAKGTPARLQPYVFFLFHFFQFKQM